MVPTVVHSAWCVVRSAQCIVQVTVHSILYLVSMDNVLFFDARCLHTAIKRDDCEKNTRGSVDFRIYPKKDYDGNSVIYKGSGRMQIEYSVGSAYHELTAMELAKTMK